MQDNRFKTTEPAALPEEWYERPPSVEEIPEGYFIVQADAGYKNGITGISVIIKTKDHEYTPRDYSARTNGPIHAELTSIKKGLDRLKSIRKDIKKVVVYNDNIYAYRFLARLWRGKRHYIKKILRDIRRIVNELDLDVEFIHIKSKHNRRVDRRAGRRRKSEEQRKIEQIQKRIMKVEEATKRGRGIPIEEKKGEYYAVSTSNPNKKYSVSLSPPSCECAWWQNNWGNKGTHIQKARALPCKHMCALAEYLGMNIFEIFKRQIERVD
jgi:ribonuclease HI